MEYRKAFIMKDGRECLLRSGTREDARQVIDCFLLTHAETDFLASYPDENRLTAENETEYLRSRLESPDELMLLAEVGGRIVGTAGVDHIGRGEKTRHRANFGISIERAFWSLGLGREMLRVCIECAKKAGYAQLELEAVGGNDRALALYESEGFVEYGRNPKGFRSRYDGWQELVYMRLELDGRAMQ